MPSSNYFLTINYNFLHNKSTKILPESDIFEVFYLIKFFRMDSQYDSNLCFILPESMTLHKGSLKLNW